MSCSINSCFEQANRLEKIQLLINECFTWELSRLFKWRIPLNSLLRGSQAASNNSPNAFCFSISRGQLLINTMTPKSFVHKSQVQLKSQFLISLEIHPVTDSVETYNKPCNVWIENVRSQNVRVQSQIVLQSVRWSIHQRTENRATTRRLQLEKFSMRTKVTMALIWHRLLRFHPRLII